MSSLPPSSTAARLLACARALLDRHGFEAVTMSDLATAAGVSRQTVYDRFGSRTGLLLALVQSLDEPIFPGELFARLAAAETPSQAVELGLDIHLHFETRIHTYAEALRRFKASDGAARAAWDDRMAQRRTMVAQMVGVMHSGGALAARWTPAEAIDFVCSLTSGSLYEELVVEDGWTPERYREVLRAAIVATVCDGAIPG